MNAIGISVSMMDEVYIQINCHYDLKIQIQITRRVIFSVDSSILILFLNVPLALQCKLLENPYLKKLSKENGQAL